MFGNVPVTRRRQEPTGDTDAFDEPITTPTDTVLSDLAGFDPGGSSEAVEVGRAAVVTTPKLYFQATVDLVEPDEVVVFGVVYKVAGNPAVWSDPFGSDVGGTVVELKNAEG